MNQIHQFVHCLIQLAQLLLVLVSVPGHFVLVVRVQPAGQTQRHLIFVAPEFNLQFVKWTKARVHVRWPLCNLLWVPWNEQPVTGICKEKTTRLGNSFTSLRQVPLFHWRLSPATSSPSSFRRTRPSWHQFTAPSTSWCRASS